MPIIASDKGGGDFTPHPEGQFSAVCVDVADLGMLPSSFKYDDGTPKPPQHKVRIYWYAGRNKSNGEPLLASKMYTCSLGSRATLRKDLESWRGRSFTPEELQCFDLEVLIGVGAFIQVSHVQKGEKTYANVVSMMKLPPNTLAPAIPDGFQRYKDRQDNHPQDTVSPDGTDYDELNPPPIDDDDLPF